jgi:ubiquinone/menaquinone biosynthesis C-methylase UbiE
MTTLNLGCGTWNRHEHDINFDRDLRCNPTVCGNVEQLPFKENSIDTIKAYHILEHIPDIIGTLNECWRVLKYNGEMKICVPMFPSVGSVADPTHVRYFIPETFLYFTERGKLPGLTGLFSYVRCGSSKDNEQLFFDMKKL